jgi:hypothetical protein
VPENSPEPQTVCETQRDAAKAARESLLEAPEQRAATAAAVLIHAECELEFFGQQAVPRSSLDAMLAEFRILRTQYQTTQNLLDEVLKYEDRTGTVGALAYLGDLNMAYAVKLRDAPAPIDVPPARGEGFKEELVDFARDFEDQAKLAYASAIDAAQGLEGPDPRVDAWTRSACAGLVKLDPAASGRRIVCNR